MSDTPRYSPDLRASGATVQNTSQSHAHDLSRREPLLTTKEAARFLGVSAAFLERDRWAGARIPFVKVGSRAVRYAVSALDDYIAKQCRHSTSEGSGP